MTRLQTVYQTEALPKLKKAFAYPNDLAAPRLVKVVVNVGIGSALKDPKHLEAVERGIAQITGQRPVRRNARKSISGFKIRRGMTVGISVTLRGPRMDDFIDRLVNIVLPRVRDFQGLDPKCFGQSGSCTIGLREQTVFPEASAEGVDHPFGLEITIVTTARTAPEGLALLRALGFPFQIPDSSKPTTA